MSSESACAPASSGVGAMLAAYLAAAADRAETRPHFDALVDVLGAGPATVALARARTEPPSRIAENVFYFPNDGFGDAADAIAAAAAAVDARFGTSLVVLVVRCLVGGPAYPFAVRIADGAGCIFFPDPGVEAAIIRHELAHIACASGHPLFDEGVAAWFEADAGEFNADVAAARPPFPFETACLSIPDDAALTRLAWTGQAAFRSSAARLVAAMVADTAPGQVLVAAARELRVVPPGSPLLDWWRTRLGSSLAAWGDESDESATGTDVAVRMAFVDHDPAAVAMAANAAGSDDYARFLAATVALFNFSPFWQSGPDILRRHADWRNATAAGTHWTGAASALARFYGDLEAAFLEADSSRTPELWWAVTRSFDAMVESHGTAPEVAAAAMVYLGRQPTVDDFDRARALALAAPFADDPVFGPAFDRLSARLGLAPATLQYADGR